MRSESQFKPGQYPVCRFCHARTPEVIEKCNTSKLDGKSKKQPFECPLPKIDFAARPAIPDPYLEATKLIDQVRKNGGLNY